MSDLKMSVSRDALHVAVSKILGVISSFETVPVLKTYHLQASGKVLKIAATDMELGVTVAVDVEKLDQEGEIALPAKKVNEIVRSLAPEGIISIEGNEGVATIRSGKTMWKIRGILGSEFPEMPSFVDDAQVWVLKREELLVILERLSGLTVGDADLRTSYKAIGVQSPYIMATNGQVLGLQEHEFECGSVKQIPGSCGRDLMAVLRLSGEDEVKVVQGNEFLFFEVGEDVFFTRLLDEWAFPDISEFIDAIKEGVEFGQISRGEFQAAVQRVKVTSSEEKHEIKLEFKGRMLKLTSSTQEGDMAEEEILCKTLHKEDGGKVCVVGWTGLVQGLDAMQADSVSLMVLETCLVLRDPGIHLSFVLVRRN